jgi:hypothetical protein
LSKRCSCLFIAVVISAVFKIQLAHSWPGGCIYLTNDGALKSAKDQGSVPITYRAKAKCSADKAVFSAIDPADKVDLGSNCHRDSFSSELGRFKVRWARSIEGCFSVSPGQVVRRAAKIVGEALSEGGFLSDLGGSTGGREWTIAFTTKQVTFAEFPPEILLGHHPGFMVPPSSVYVIADNINSGCVNYPGFGREVARGEGRQVEPDVAKVVLTGVLLHEFGHLIEYLLLGGRGVLQDRARAEGFAVWFEGYALQFVSDIDGGRELSSYSKYLGSRFGGGGEFSEDVRGYVAAGERFSRLVKRGGIAKLLRVYRLIREEGISFEAAELRVFGAQYKP